MLIHLEKLGKSFGEKIVLHDVTASVEREDRIGIVGQNGAGKTTLLKILTGEYTDYEGEFSVTHGVTLGYLEQNAKLDPTLDIYGEMRSCFAHVLDAMAQMQILERRMAASPEDASLLEQHDALQNIIDAADGYNMDVNIKKVLSGMGFAQDTWTKNIAVLSGGELTRLRLAKLLLEKPDVLILDEPTNHLDADSIEWLRGFLKKYEGGFLVISHSTELLDEVVNKVWHLDAQTGQIDMYSLGWKAYLHQRVVDEERRRHEREVAEKKADRLMKQGIRLHAKATKAVAAQNMMRRAERLLSETSDAQKQDKVADIRFPEPAPCGRTPIMAKDISKGIRLQHRLRRRQPRRRQRLPRRHPRLQRRRKNHHPAPARPHRRPRHRRRRIRPRLQDRLLRPGARHPRSQRHRA